MAELSTVARPYAEALFAAVRDDAEGLGRWAERVDELAQVAALPDVQAALNDPRLSAKQRFELFAGLVKSDLPPAARNFIELLTENGRLLLLPEISVQFNALKLRHEGSAQAEIVSAYELDAAQVDTLVAGLEKKFGLKIEAHVTVDPSLIGGVRVTVGDQVLDTSVQAQLAGLRDALAA